MCSDKYEYQVVVPLKEYLEKIIELRFEAIDAQTAEAKRLMENTMAGFPEQFLKIGSFEPVKAELKAITKILDQMDGKASQASANMAIAISVTAFIMGLFALLLRFYRV